MKEEKLWLISQKQKGSYKNTMKKVYNTKFNNLEEMDQYLEKYNISRLNQEELEI